MVVAKTVAGTGAADPASASGADVKPTVGMDRTAFNVAARTIRPAVVGIRAAI